MSSSLYKAVCQPGVTPFPLISYLMRSNLVAGKVMALPSTLFLIFFSATPILGRTVWPEPKEGRTALTQDRQQRSASEVIKVLDFSDDIDHQPDSNGEYTSATSEGLALPESFTICAAVMVEAWTTDFSSVNMFILMDAEGSMWGYVQLGAAYVNTKYQVQLGPLFNIFAIEAKFFPLQWSNVCLTVDSPASKVTLVADGRVLGEEEYKREEDEYKLSNVSLVLGHNPKYLWEPTGRIAELNIFSSPLSKERMIAQTEAGGEKCGAPGDLVNWEEAEWTLHSQAKVIEMDREWEGPCRRESKIQYYTADFKHQEDCMRHCPKISGGRVPPVTTREEWENLIREFTFLTPDISSWIYFWLSATEGDIEKRLTTRDHWPETEVVKNKTQKLKAEETIWRDYYTGERLTNWAFPYYFKDKKDTIYGETFNCMYGYIVSWEKFIWFEWQCITSKLRCPCSYPTQPLLRLRGLCSTSSIDNLFSPKQLPDNPGNMILLSLWSTRIVFNDSTSQWILTDARNDVTAMSRAAKLSYVLGKHEWTISNDVFECGEGKPYTTKLKLTGCNPEGEFTCDNGQCVKMEERCNQVPDCKDESDEKGCQVIILKDGYNKKVPPIGRAKTGRAIPADVSISITLMKVVEIEEVDHSIHLQFQISLSWKENRVKYQNLKKEVSLNSLSDEDIKTIWLPLIFYDNTDQKASTRLGEYGNGEWMTRVTVTREGNFTRSPIEELDEAEIFKGDENRLTMNQTYTLEFQCKYELQRYPFDTQVN